MARKIIFNPLSGTFDYIDESSGGGGGGGDVDSVFGRTGDVVAQPDDYTWAQIDKTTSDIADITTKSHTSLSDIGTNSHADIDNHISDTDNPHDTTVANLDDTTIDTPVNRHALLHDGTDWKNRAITEADISDLDHYDSTDFDTDLSGKSTTDLSEGTNLYYTEARVSANTDVAANTSHRGTTTGNPHSVTKSDVGLGDVDNTSDTDKPVSTAQQAEIDTKADDSEVVKLTGDQTVAGIKTHSSFPVTPSSAPTTDYQVANKKYVDDNSGGGGSGDMEASVYDPAGGERQVAFEDELPDVSDFETTTELNARDTANRNRANHTGTQTLATLSDLANIYPVGTLYINDENDANPSTYLPGQSGSTWEAITDRVIVGAGSTFSAKETGGNTEHTLTEAQLPVHNHASGSLSTSSDGTHDHVLNLRTGSQALEHQGSTHVGGGSTASGASATSSTPVQNGGSHSHSISGSTANAGSGNSFGIMNPYYGAYCWRRAA